jgi:hypothetical protein
MVSNSETRQLFLVSTSNNFNSVALATVVAFIELSGIPVKKV